jgi:hypothetical protein
MRPYSKYLTAAHRKRDRRGVALILVMMVTVVFFILIGSLLEVLAMESHSVKTSAESNAALIAAYSGVDAQILTIETFYINGVGMGQPPDAGEHTYPNQSGSSTITGYETGITQTYADTAGGLKYFLITSTGFVRGDPATSSGSRLIQRQVTALVQEASFGQYSSFDKAGNSNLYYSNPQQYQGAVYSGGPMRIRYDPSSTTPIFAQGFTTDKNPIWFDAATGKFTGVPTGAGYNAVFGAGTGFQAHIEKDLPGLSQNLIVFSQAFQGDSTQTTLDQFNTDTSSLSAGVYLDKSLPQGGGAPLTTGIFVEGKGANVDLIASSTDTTQTFKFTGHDYSFPDTTVVVDFSANTTTVTEAGSPTTVYSGVPSAEGSQNSSGNGAIFIDGGLTIEAGSTIHGQYSIALPDPPTSSGQRMTLKGSITYHTKPDPALGVTSSDELSLWANDIALNDQTSGGSGAAEIDAMIMTGYLNECIDAKCADGMFFNPNCDTTGCGGAMGNLTLFGSLIQNFHGKLGQLGPDGNLVGGFLRSVVYDARLGANPPPFTPTTNQYNVIAISDDDQPIGIP